MKSKHLLFLGAALCCVFTAVNPASAQGTAFTYSGRLNDTNGPANGNYDLQFALFSAVTNGTTVAGSLTNAPLGVTNGLFTATLDFGAGIFEGSARWLEIAVRTNGSVGAYDILSPRTRLTPTPYAIYAGGVAATGISGTIPSGTLSGTYGNALTLNNVGNSFSGNGASVTNVNAAMLGGLSVSNFWRTAGNAGTTAGTHFLGTTDEMALEFKVNGLRALRLEPVGAGDFAAANLIAGSHNSLEMGVWAATIGGGYSNIIGPSVMGPTISGGAGNSLKLHTHHATIGGGRGNSINDDANDATIGGGSGNKISLNGYLNYCRRGQEPHRTGGAPRHHWRRGKQYHQER